MVLGGNRERPLCACGDAVQATQHYLGKRYLYRRTAELLFTENETNMAHLRRP